MLPCNFFPLEIEKIPLHPLRSATQQGDESKLRQATTLVEGSQPGSVLQQSQLLLCLLAIVAI